MSSVYIQEMNKDSPYWDNVEKLFVQLYCQMQNKGLLMPLVEQGEKKWRASLGNTLGRYSVLKIAIEGNANVVGFICGTIRLAPNYIGGCRVGYISHIFVKPDLCGKGVGKQLVREVEEWFDDKKVNSIELQVLCNNTSAIDFWEILGYKKELFQMRQTK